MAAPSVVASSECVASAAALCGTWYQPEPIVLVPGEEAGTVRDEAGDGVKLVMTESEEDGKTVRLVTLSCTGDFAMTGYMNLKRTRVHWENGCRWVRSAELASPPEQTEPGSNPVEATPAGGPGEKPDGEPDEGRAPACCCSFGAGRRQQRRAPQPPAPQPPAPAAAPAMATVEPAGRAAPPSGRVLSVEIISACVLRGPSGACGEEGQQEPHSMDASRGVYCTCKVQSGPGGASFATPALLTHSPVWRRLGRLDNYADGQGLEFTLWEKAGAPGGRAIGRAALRSEQFCPGGFEGEVPIEGADAGTKASLKIDIAPADGPASRGRFLSPSQEESVAQRVSASPDAAAFAGAVGQPDVAGLVRAASRQLPQAMRSFGGGCWTKAVQLLMDDSLSAQAKAAQLSAVVRDSFAAPLIGALQDILGRLPGLLRASALGLLKALALKAVSALVEAIAGAGLAAIGLRISTSP